MLMDTHADDAFGAVNNKFEEGTGLTVRQFDETSRSYINLRSPEKQLQLVVMEPG